MAHVCPACGADNEPAAQFCGQCGAAIPVQAGGPAPLTTPAVQPAAQAQPPVHGLAVLSLVFGLLGLCCLLPIVGSIAGVVLGVLALRRINESAGKFAGQSMAVAGIVASVVGAVCLVAIVASTTNLFDRYHLKSTNTTCISNEKQLVIGVLMYSQDYDEHYPRVANWNDGIFPYIKNTTVFSCPSAGSTVPNYGMNRALDGIRPPRIANPAALVALFDSKVLERNVAGDLSMVDYRHGGGYNAAFADGHVRVISPGQAQTATQWTPSPGL